MRTSRTNGTDTYTYLYSNGLLTQMTKNGVVLYFTYDAVGIPLTVQYNGTVYYYVTNLQGDVVAILDSSGNAVAKYLYNAWGVPVLTTFDSGSTDLYAVNPLRYRGYIYDNETGLYYLQSRYYNPKIGRFISADNYPSTGQGLTGNNMFAYCGNNPVAREDDGGEFWNYVIGGIVGAIAGGVIAALNGEDAAGIAIGAVAGLASGLVAASGLGWIAQAGISAGISFAADALNQCADIYQSDELTINDFNLGHAFGEAVLGGLTSAAGSGLGFVTGKYITKTSVASAKAFDRYLYKRFARGIGEQAVLPTMTMVKQAGKALSQSTFYNNVTQGVSSVIGSVISLWNIWR